MLIYLTPIDTNFDTIFEKVIKSYGDLCGLNF